MSPRASCCVSLILTTHDHILFLCLLSRPFVLHLQNNAFLPRSLDAQIDVDGLTVTAEYQVRNATRSGDISPPTIIALGGYYTRLAVRKGGGGGGGVRCLQACEACESQIGETVFTMIITGREGTRNTKDSKVWIWLIMFGDNFAYGSHKIA